MRTGQSIVNIPPPKAAGVIEYHFGRHKTFCPHGGPMNGQTARLEIVRSLIERCEIEQIVETGTFRGTTTEWFAQFNIPVFSAEIQPRFAAFSQRRMMLRENVCIENADSIAALTRWADLPEIRVRRTLFYLDAHWQKFLPLRKELEVINQKFSEWIVVIDDFKVPSDEGYGFDDYGPGSRLDFEYLTECNIRYAIAFVPNVKAKWETGWKRGCIILVSSQYLAAKCRQLQMLRPAFITSVDDIAERRAPEAA